jgi:hypothetical protein
MMGTSACFPTRRRAAALADEKGTMQCRPQGLRQCLKVWIKPMPLALSPTVEMFKEPLVHKVCPPSTGLCADSIRLA